MPQGLVREISRFREPGRGHAALAYALTDVLKVFSDGHAGNIGEILFPLQAPSAGKNSSLTLSGHGQQNALAMTDPEITRARLRAFMAQHGLKVKTWSLKAGMSDRTLGMFLSGKSQSMKFDSLQKLAECENVTVETLVGEPAEAQNPQSVALSDEEDGVMANAELIVRLLKDLKELSKEQLAAIKALSDGEPQGEKPAQTASPPSGKKVPKRA